jgi:hypothetical protein
VGSQPWSFLLVPCCLSVSNLTLGRCYTIFMPFEVIKVLLYSIAEYRLRKRLVLSRLSGLKVTMVLSHSRSQWLDPASSRGNQRNAFKILISRVHLIWSIFPHSRSHSSRIARPLAVPWSLSSLHLESWDTCLKIWPSLSTHVFESRA